MSFQIKNFQSIVASLINVSRASQTRITDFSVGAVARTLMESPAVEIEELYLQMYLGLQDAIPVAIYKAFDFDIVEALPAAGVLTVSFPAAVSAVSIPEGASFEVSQKGLVFQSLMSLSIAVGDTQVVIPVACTTAGTAGNIAANEITDSESLLPPGATLTNLPFVSGKDAESEVERKTRFNSFILSISRGTVDAIRFAAESVQVFSSAGAVQEYVTRIGIDEHAGRLEVYVSSSVGAPTLTLLSKVQGAIDGYVDPATGRRVNGYRPAGVSVTVLPMQERVVPIGLSVSTRSVAQNTAEMISNITTVLARVVAGVSPGSVLRVDAITSAVLSLPDVMTCNVTNTNNSVCGQFERLMLGAVTVTWVSNA